MQPLRNTIFLIWLALVLATTLSLVVSIEHPSSSVGVPLLVLIALFKMRLVLMYFMEVRHAPVALRIVLEGWLLLVGIGMNATYFFVGRIF